VILDAFLEIMKSVEEAYQDVGDLIETMPVLTIMVNLLTKIKPLPHCEASQRAYETSTNLERTPVLTSAQ
jgi:hypothetical protein